MFVHITLGTDAQVILEDMLFLNLRLIYPLTVVSVGAIKTIWKDARLKPSQNKHQQISLIS